MKKEEKVNQREAGSNITRLIYKRSVIKCLN